MSGSGDGGFVCVCEGGEMEDGDRDSEVDGVWSKELLEVMRMGDRKRKKSGNEGEMENFQGGKKGHFPQSSSFWELYSTSDLRVSNKECFMGTMPAPFLFAAGIPSSTGKRVGDETSDREM